jgi:hypothetical protein
MRGNQKVLVQFVYWTANMEDLCEPKADPHVNSTIVCTAQPQIWRFASSAPFDGFLCCCFSKPLSSRSVAPSLTHSGKACVDYWLEQRKFGQKHLFIAGQQQAGAPSPICRENTKPEHAHRTRWWWHDGWYGCSVLPPELYQQPPQAKAVKLASFLPNH